MVAINYPTDPLQIKNTLLTRVVFTCYTGKNERHFGKTFNGEMHLSEEGELLQAIWRELPQRCPIVRIDNCTATPDTFHGILMIDIGDDDPAILIHEVIRKFKNDAAFELRRFNPKFSWKTRHSYRTIKSVNDLDKLRNYMKLIPTLFAEKVYGKRGPLFKYSKSAREAEGVYLNG